MNTNQEHRHDLAELEREEAALWRDEGTWFEFLNNVGCDPDYESLMKEARLSLIGHSDYAVTYDEGRAFMIAFIKAYRKWCEDQAASVKKV